MRMPLLKPGGDPLGGQVRVCLNYSLPAYHPADNLWWVDKDYWKLGFPKVGRKRNEKAKGCITDETESLRYDGTL